MRRDCDDQEFGNMVFIPIFFYGVFTLSWGWVLAAFAIGTIINIIGS